MKVSRECLKEVTEALDRYVIRVNEAQLRDSAKRTYVRDAETFVRWLSDDFEPGEGQRKTR